jgi:hypothetical protein
MARYIDADKAKQEFNIGFGGVSHAVIANQVIDGIPTADVEEVKHGEWIPCGDGEHTPLMCSSCLNTWGFYKQRGSVYCPLCGAKMDGGKE